MREKPGCGLCGALPFGKAARPGYTHMRTKNSLRNTLFAVGGYIITFVFGLVLRKLFIENLDYTNLGYEGLFTNIFDFLVVADLGAGSLVTYRLYAALARGDAASVAKLTALYRKLNLVLSGVVMLLSACVLPFLKFIIREETADWGYVYWIYALQMLNLVALQPFSFARTLIVADQKSYQTAIIDTSIRVLVQIAKAVVIILFHSYIGYLLLAIFCNLMMGVVSYIRCKKEYPDALRGRATWRDFTEGGFFSELKGVGVSRLLNSVYYATDSVLISALLGIKSVALYGNYTVISINVNAMFASVLQPVSASIGNYVNTEREDSSFRLFSAVDLISFCLASFAMVSYATLFQPLITMLYGDAFLLPQTFVLLFSVYNYLYIKNLGITSFRGTFGHYREEWAWIGAAAVANIVLSIVCCKLYGIVGIVMGTVASMILLWIGKSILTFRYCFARPGAGYMARQACRLLLAVAEMLTIGWIANRLPVDLGGFVLRALLCLVVPNALHLLLYRKTEAFAILRGYLGKALSIIKNRNAHTEGEAS